jgi:hypothetical protein
MRRTLVLCAALAAAFTGTAVALAATGEDDYGPGYGGTTTAPASTTAVKSTSGKTSTYSYRAKLDVKSETPKPNAPAKASGVFNATVTEKGGKATIRWTLTFGRLSGKAVAAHIHKGAPGVAGAVVVPLCAPCRNGQNKRQAIDEDLAEALEKGGYYVNVHTAKNAGGEIRGQLKLVGK